MRAYRDGTCGFCELHGETVCPRCQVVVCAAHQPTTEAFCALCCKELKDDRDVAAFRVASHERVPDTGWYAAISRQGGFIDAFADPIVRAIQTRLRERRVRRIFDARSPS